MGGAKKHFIESINGWLKEWNANFDVILNKSRKLKEKKNIEIVSEIKSMERSRDEIQSKIDYLEKNSDSNWKDIAYRIRHSARSLTEQINKMFIEISRNLK